MIAWHTKHDSLKNAHMKTKNLYGDILHRKCNIDHIKLKYLFEMKTKYHFLLYSDAN